MGASDRSGRERCHLQAEPTGTGRGSRDSRRIGHSGHPLGDIAGPDEHTTSIHRLPPLSYSSWECDYPPIGSICQVAKLTTTSYLILGLLALRRWSTYELAQQMKRSIHFYWPRAESHIYEEPKKLVAHGLAAASSEQTGRRPRTMYAITDA